MHASIGAEMFTRQYSTVFGRRPELAEPHLSPGRHLRLGRPTPPTSAKRPTSTACPRNPPTPSRHRAARCLAVLGDSSHNRPHLTRRLHQEERSGRQIPHRARRRPRTDFNSYGSRRGNHEVMVRGTFANVRLRNKMAPGTEGGVTRLLPDGSPRCPSTTPRLNMPNAAPRSIILAGKEYGSGSSRDWAAKGPRLLGIRFVIAEATSASTART